MDQLLGINKDDGNVTPVEAALSITTQDMKVLVMRRLDQLQAKCNTLYSEKFM